MVVGSLHERRRRRYPQEARPQLHGSLPGSLDGGERGRLRGQAAQSDRSEPAAEAAGNNSPETLCVKFDFFHVSFRTVQ